MKKIIFSLVVLFTTFSFNSYSQTLSTDFSSLDQLVIKLKKACDKMPNETGETDVDLFVDGNKKAAQGAVSSAAQLHELYSREIGENKDGVQDVTVKKPTLEEWVNLATTIATQAAGMTELGVAGKKAADTVKKANKMAALKYAKPMKWATDIMPVTGEALAEEGKAIDQIIKLLKSENNL